MTKNRDPDPQWPLDGTGTDTKHTTKESPGVGAQVDTPAQGDAKKELLSFRGLMAANTPSHGIGFKVDRRKNGYVRHRDRGPWIRIDSPKASALVAAAMCEGNGSVSRQMEVQEAIEKLKMLVLLAAATDDVWLRVAALPTGGVEIFIGDADDTRIRVTPGRVEILRGDSSNTQFYVTQATAPFVLPADQGDLQLLDQYLNLDPIDRALVVGWITYVLVHPKRSGVGFPILVIGGEHGAGKTVLSYVLQAFVDPSLLGVQAFPRNERDFAVTTQASSVVFYDNMRDVTADASDWLCRAATGGVFAIRKLYSDGDIVALPVHGAIVMNSIHELLHQPDLAQRCLKITLLPIDPSKRRSETVLRQEFERDRPAIFRGLLELAAKALAHLPTVEVVHPERMYDFVRWLAALEKAIGAPNAPYQAAYSESLRRCMRGSLEEQPLAGAILDFVDSRTSSEWSGTPGDLLEELSNYAGRRAMFQRDWPANPSAMSKRLKTLVPALRQQGVELRFGRGRERQITIVRTSEGHDHD